MHASTAWQELILQRLPLRALIAWQELFPELLRARVLTVNRAILQPQAGRHLAATAPKAKRQQRGPVVALLQLIAPQVFI